MLLVAYCMWSDSTLSCVIDAVLGGEIEKILSDGPHHNKTDPRIEPCVRVLDHTTISCESCLEAIDENNIDYGLDCCVGQSTGHHCDLALNQRNGMCLHKGHMDT